jgi:hypothetical protein
MARYTSKQRDKVIGRAMAAVEARQAGQTAYKAGGQIFGLEAGGLCNRFIRQVVETALGLPEQSWEYRGATATETLNHLRRDGYEVPMDSLQPGDIIGHTSGKAGHIVLCVGNYYDDGRWLVAENTSQKRGAPNAPGTKCTRLATVLSLGYRYRAFRLFPEEG